MGRRKKTEIVPVSSRIQAYKKKRIIYLGDAQLVTRVDELSENQLKIAMYAAAQVKQDDTPSTVYTLSYTEYAKMVGLESDGGREYKRIFDDAAGLMRLGMDFVAKNGDMVGFNWLSGVVVAEKGELTYTIDRNLLPFYKTAGGAFTVIGIQDYMRLGSRYGLLLYEFLAGFVKAEPTQVYQTVDQLREQLQVAQELYPLAADFLRWTVDAAVTDINSKVQSTFTVKTRIKRGLRNKIEGVLFTVTPIRTVETEPDPVAVVKAELIADGVTSLIATRLITTYPLERIKANADLARARKPQNLGAMIATAIKKDWAAEKNKQQELFEAEKNDPDREIYKGPMVDAIRMILQQGEFGQEKTTDNAAVFESTVEALKRRQAEREKAEHNN